MTARTYVGTAGADYYFDFGTPGRSAAETLAELDTAEQTLRAGMSAASQRKEAEAALAAEAQHIRSETAAERTTLAEPTATPTPKPTKRVKEGRSAGLIYALGSPCVLERQELDTFLIRKKTLESRLKDPKAPKFPAARA